MTDGLKLHHHRSVSVYGDYGITLYEKYGMVCLAYFGCMPPFDAKPIPIDRETLKTLLPALMHYAATGRLPEEPK